MANFDNAFRQRRLADLMNSDDPESMAIVRQIQNEDANEAARLGNYPAPQQPNFDNEARRLSNYALPQRAPHDAYDAPSYANEDARLRNYAPQQPNFDNEARRLGNYPATLGNLVNPVNPSNPERDALNAKLSKQYMRGDSSGAWQSQDTPFEPRQQQQQPQQRAELQPNSFRNNSTGVVTKLSDTPPMWAGQQHGQPEVLEQMIGFDKSGNQDGTIHRIVKVPAQNGAAATTRFEKVYMPGRSPNDESQAKIDRQTADIAHVRASTNKLNGGEVPAGYRSSGNGLEAIPGGPADPRVVESKRRATPMSTAAQRELIETDEAVQGGMAAIKAFNQALDINKDAMGFRGAGIVSGMGTLLPESLRPKTVDATENLDNILTGAALPSLKAIFGGMPTEGERKVLLEVQGSSNKSPAVRQDIFNRAISAADARMKFSQDKAKQIRSGSYFSNDGMANAPAAPVGGQQQPSAPRVTSIDDIMKTAREVGKTVDQVLKDAKAKGYQVKGM